MLLNISILLIIYTFWIITQKLLSTDVEAKGEIIDRIHNCQLISNLNSWFKNNHQLAKYNIIISTLLIDLSLIYMVYDFLFYNNYKVIITLFIGLILRQMCQFINRLPTPKDMIWFDPQFGTLTMVYQVTNDFFFSGHTLIALIMGLEFYNTTSMLIKILAIIFMMYEILFILIINGHYFMDVYGAIATYFMINYLIEYLLKLNCYQI